MAALGSPIVVDGSHGEGGGALLRTCLVMSSLTQQAVRLEGVRGGTKYPGLEFEDLVILRALAKACEAETTGATLGSTGISFLPTRRPRALNGTLDLADEDRSGRGASAPVVLCTLLPVLARSGAYSQIDVAGETYRERSLSFDYFQNVTLTVLRRLGLHACTDMSVAGFGQESKGRISCEVEPSAIQPIDWSTRGELIRCQAIVSTSGLPASVGERALAHLATLAQSANLGLEAGHNSVDSRTPGAFVTVWAEFQHGVGGATARGKRGLRVEGLVQGAFQEMLSWLSEDASADPYLVDQVLVTACLAEGETVLKTNRITHRLLTAIWVIKQFIPIKITVLGVVNGPGTLTVRR